jgi:hypothetical protein
LFDPQREKIVRFVATTGAITTLHGPYRTHRSSVGPRGGPLSWEYSKGPNRRPLAVNRIAGRLNQLLADRVT